MASEAEFVVAQFEKHFMRFQQEKIAIYGLGQNTRVLLEAFPEFPVVGLMDEARTGDMVWGLPVIDCDEAHAQGVSAILILARASNLAIIYRRIAEDCERYSIPVYDINGRRIEKQKEEERTAAMEFYRKNQKYRLMEKIRQADVVSFDIFDTLLMRRTLYATDVFLLVEETARQSGIIEEGVPFAKRRRVAEQELSVTGCPTIHSIYHAMIEKGNIRGEQAEGLQQLEIAEEKRQLLPRKGMAEILSYAKEEGKILCCTSDMYLPKTILEEILREKGMEGFDRILVSCEEGVSKSNGLFQVLKSCYPGKRILHIGDSEEADIRGAERYGIDDTFPLRSALDMLGDSVAAELLEFTDTLGDRLEVGRFLASQMSDPFLFRRTEGKLEITSYYEMGRDFVEPMMAAFLRWMMERCEADHIDMVLLGARDGWLLTKLLDIVSQDRTLPFAYRYVPASRTACTIAGVESREDVAYVAGQAFSGTAEELLRKRFQLQEEILPREPGEPDREYVLRHADIILEHAKKHRINYLDALQSLGIEMGQKKAYFDFVSSGTCQMWMERILGEKLKGYYFVRFLEKEKEKLDIEAFLAAVLPMQEVRECRLLENYFLIEAMISAPMPFLLRVGENGRLVYDKEGCIDEQKRYLQEIQQGIRDGFSDYGYQSNQGHVSVNLINRILGFLMSGTCVKGQMEDAKVFCIADEFCNRIYKTVLKEKS